MSSASRIARALDEAGQAATSLQLHLAWKQLECAIRWPTEVRYREDQPRAPGGTRNLEGVGIGGRWVLDLLTTTDAEEPAGLVAARTTGPRCTGLADGCQSGGTYGTSGIFKPMGTNLNLCWNCAIKWLRVENEPAETQLEMIRIWDKNFRP